MIILGSANTGKMAGDGDPYWDDVVLLLDANDGGIADLSQSDHAITAAFGSVTVSTEQAKFGTKSFKFPGTAQARLSFPDSADWDFGTGDFTIEVFARRPNTTAKPIICIGDAYTNGSGLQLQWDTSELDIERAGGFISSSAVTMDANTWHHLAISRASGTVYFGVNGTIVSSSTLSHSFSPSTGNNAKFAFGDNRLDNVLTGYMDQMRITKGVGRYTGTYTVPTEPFPTA